MTDKAIKRKKKKGIVQTPSTTVRPIPDELKAKIIELAPNLDFGMVLNAAHVYNLTYDMGRHKRATRQKLDAVTPVQDQMKAVQDQAAKLWETLNTLNLSARALLLEKAAPFGGIAFVSLSDTVLSNLVSIATDAYDSSQISKGRPRSSRQNFAQSIANILIFSGYPVDTKQSGLLFRISKLLLEHFDDCPDDLTKMLKSVLGVK